MHHTEVCAGPAGRGDLCQSGGRDLYGGRDLSGGHWPRLGPFASARLIAGIGSFSGAAYCRDRLIFRRGVLPGSAHFSSARLLPGGRRERT